MTDLNAPRLVAGWYQDASMVETLRYWDGQGWTDHVAPTVRAQHVTATEKTPAGKVKVLFLGMLGVLVFAFLVALLDTFVGGNLYVIGVLAVLVFSAPWYFMRKRRFARG